jgi:hypothetical protein
MLAGFSGSLVSEYFAESLLESTFGGELGKDTREAGRRRMRACLTKAAPVLGPVSSARAVHDVAAAPIVSALGFDQPLDARGPGGSVVVSRLEAGPEGVALLSAAWSQPLDAAWRAALPLVIASRASWCLCTNGRLLRLADARRALARSFVDFDLEEAVASDETFAVAWALLRRESFDAVSLAGRAAAASSRHTIGVCVSLRNGVLEALRELIGGLSATRAFRRRRADLPLDDLYGQALTIVYRVLFLLFAESRGLVPLWHPVYRESYSMEALRDLAERHGQARGLWEALQATSRLAHAGCRAGSLRVTPFNGRLFAPSATPLAEEPRLGDESARRLVLALSTQKVRRDSAPSRIVYRDLGVEQLGAVYESVLDYRLVASGSRLQASGSRPCPASAVRVTLDLVPGCRARKATGTFYTPRSLTTHLVEQALSPLTAGVRPDDILSLRVLDPAMGSGAFLVAACRYLAGAYEAALVEQGGCHPSDFSDRDRRGFRRLVAQRCLYGVDLNPMAVQLARLSLWLCTLAPERPLSFLDHRLQTGDSLVGASLDDIRRPPPGRVQTASRRGRDTLPLFEQEDAGPALRAVLPERLRVASTPDDSLAAVRDKERTMSALGGPASPLARWKSIADLWCSAVCPEGDLQPGVFFAVSDALLEGATALPEGAVRSCLERAGASAARRRFFHWTFEFPEVFFDGEGAPRPDAGFDAIVGNPPWDMVRNDNGDGEGAEARSRDLMAFTRRSGLYRFQGDGHSNLFQLFVERAVRLARQGGRLGLVLPWGLAADAGSSRLRQLLFDHCVVDSVVGFENNLGIFPIHRSLRFVLLTASTGGRTSSFSCRLGLRDPAALEAVSRGEGGTPAASVVVTRRALERVTPGELAVPDVRGPADMALLEKLVEGAPRLGANEGWGAVFGRELNASDDAAHFVGAGDGLPVLEGKHVEPFRVAVPAMVRRLPSAAAVALLNRARTWGRARLAYRDVASATNRLTLIAAVVPAGVVTVHSLFCLKTPLAPRDQAFLCGVLNSLVSNYLVRLRVTTHVTAGIVSWLPVPRPAASSRIYRSIVNLATRLMRSTSPTASPDYASLQAEVARLYGLTGDEFRHVLTHFPLVDEATRRSALGRFLEPSPGRVTRTPPRGCRAGSPARCR